MSRKNKKKSPFVPKLKEKVEKLPTSFQINYHLHKPWADVLFETQLPPEIMEKMLEISDEILADSKRTSWGNNLAGQIKDEPLIEPSYLKNHNVTDFFGNMVLEYVHQCNLQKAPPQYHGDMERLRNSIKVTINSMWIVEQQAGEYNPLHVHTNCDVSSVMYLKVPKFLPSEKRDRDDDGAILFVGSSGGGESKLKTATVKIKPHPGQFFIFPSHMQHAVYPYKTDDSFARRSISFNASFEYLGQGGEGVRSYESLKNIKKHGNFYP